MTDVILPSGKQYQISWDAHGNLRAVTLPGLGRHHFHEVTTLALRRRVFHPAATEGRYVQDYDAGGALLRETYPSELRGVYYEHARDGRLRDVFHDWTRVAYSYHESAGLVRAIQLTNRVAFNFSCQLVYEPPGALVRTQLVNFNRTGFR